MAPEALSAKEIAAIDQYHSAVRKWLSDEMAQFCQDFLAEDRGDDDAMLTHRLTARLVKAEWTMDRNATIHALAGALIALERASL